MNGHSKKDTGASERHGNLNTRHLSIFGNDIGSPLGGNPMYTASCSLVMEHKRQCAEVRLGATII